jgi:DNA helicase-2/ATP-dependent DNA helicase PcrA
VRPPLSEFREWMTCARDARVSFGLLLITARQWIKLADRNNDVLQSISSLLLEILMTIGALLSELNDRQRVAATMQNQHVLVLAGAGCGKTKTIVARAAFLISNGTPANRIQILTFTRRAASEIVERVRLHLGDAAEGLRASTFHTWCISLIRRAPAAFGCKDHSIIDRDDQLQLFKVLRGKYASSRLPVAAKICDIYSFARNTGKTLEATLLQNYPDAYSQKEQIAGVMIGYEARKKNRHYLDYDDILDIVAQQLSSSSDTRNWVASQYDYLLIDEMQDTNPLQWKLIDPLKNKVTLFCVGDDAQSIYGFRGADFRNVHSFSERVQGSVTLKLEQNYRSTQEILNISNWLLATSPLNYGKELNAVRGTGAIPQLHTFSNEWEEGRWIGEDLLRKRGAGAAWRKHMILVRSSFAAKTIEASLLAKEIPYRFIGGTKLMDAAHVRDVLSVLRVVGNPLDEIGWMRFLTLWNGVGEVIANRIIESILTESDLGGCIQALKNESKIPAAALSAIQSVAEAQNKVGMAVVMALKAMDALLSEKYQKKDWDKRRRDFRLVEKLAEKHTSILAFIEDYLLDPVHESVVDRLEADDVVTIITIHSAKGTECEVCYVVNVSPGAYPSQYAIGNIDDVEEERRVLYVAMTRAKDELIVTRHGYRFWSQQGRVALGDTDEMEVESYFLNSLPGGFFDDHIHQQDSRVVESIVSQGTPTAQVGISLGFSMSSDMGAPALMSEKIQTPLPALINKITEFPESIEQENQPISQSIPITLDSGHSENWAEQEETDLPMDVLDVIKAKALSDYPRDLSMQEYVAEEQMKAYGALHRFHSPDIPREILVEAFEKATIEYPADFSMRLYVVNDQIDSFKKLQQFRPASVPQEVMSQVLSKAANDYPKDYAMRLYVAKDQTDSFKKLLKLNIPDVPENVKSNALEKSKNDYPDDYAMRLYIFNEIIKEYRSITRT